MIFALADGYSGSQSIPIDTEAGIPTDSIVIEMEEANEFRGIVVDPSGNPIPGAVAGLESRMRILPGDEYRGIVFTESYRTKDDGSFVIPNRGRYADGIIVQHAKFARIKHPLPAEWNNEEPLYIYMSPGGSIEGVVLDEKQEPAVGALIHIRSESDRLFGAAAVIDQNGHYRIDHLPEFNYFVDVEGDFKRISVLVQEGQTIRADISADIPPEVNPEQ